MTPIQLFYASEEYWPIPPDHDDTGGGGLTPPSPSIVAAERRVSAAIAALVILTGSAQAELPTHKPVADEGGPTLPAVSQRVFPHAFTHEEEFGRVDPFVDEGEPTLPAPITITVPRAFVDEHEEIGQPLGTPTWLAEELAAVTAVGKPSLGVGLFHTGGEQIPLQTSGVVDEEYWPEHLVVVQQSVPTVFFHTAEGFGQIVAEEDEPTLAGPVLRRPFIPDFTFVDDPAPNAPIAIDLEPPSEFAGPVIRAPSLPDFFFDDQLPGAVGTIVEEYERPVGGPASTVVATYLPPQQEELPPAAPAEGVDDEAPPLLPAVAQPTVLFVPWGDEDVPTESPIALEEEYFEIEGAKAARPTVFLPSDEGAFTSLAAAPVGVEEGAPVIHVVARAPWLEIIGVEDRQLPLVESIGVDEEYEGLVAPVVHRAVHVPRLFAPDETRGTIVVLYPIASKTGPAIHESMFGPAIVE